MYFSNMGMVFGQLVGGSNRVSDMIHVTSFNNQGKKLFLVDGKWEEWSVWENCDKCCGGESQRRFRTCDNPPPGPNGKKCRGETVEKRKCNTNACKGDLII